jgi:RNA polymerase sigma factor (sigma-70 family)
MSALDLVVCALLVQRRERAASEPDEAALIAAAGRSDRRAFDALYRRHAQRVYARLTRLIGPSLEREDLMQQIFLELYRALPNYREEGSFASFVHGITVRVGYDHLRQRARKPSVPLSDEGLDALMAAGGSPEAQARERELLARAFRLLDALKPKKRVAFVLHVVEGLSLEEMSRMLDTDARTLG